MLTNKILLRSALAAVIALLAMVTTSVSWAEAPWAMIGANSVRTNQSSFQGPGEEIGLVWKVPTLHTEPFLYATVGENGTVLCQELRLLAYDGDGRLLFESDLGPAYYFGTEVGLIIRPGLRLSRNVQPLCVWDWLRAAAGILADDPFSGLRSFTYDER